MSFNSIVNMLRNLCSLAVSSVHYWFHTSNFLWFYKTWIIIAAAAKRFSKFITGKVLQFDLQFFTIAFLFFQTGRGSLGLNYSF
jgi:hypothetical protein